MLALLFSDRTAGRNDAVERSQRSFVWFYSTHMARPLGQRDTLRGHRY
jgi:hypothetical protein